MDHIIPISDLQTKTKEIVERVKATHDPIMVTQRGRPAALIVNVEEYESLLHTLDEMSYPDWEEKLIEAERDSRKKKGVTLKQLKKKIKR